MEESPPFKPPRGVKPIKETRVLMSVIRSLTASETDEQRDREKANLEMQYRLCDQKLDELVSKHEDDLTLVMQMFGNISQSVNENRVRIKKIKESLIECRKVLGYRKERIRNLWRDRLEYKYILDMMAENKGNS
ncbi:exocyst complex component 4 isoform X2 [Coccinella septempunctata]|nr:exocyst complex component 4 isoform X2 [Coccinella septempunctata]